MSSVKKECPSCAMEVDEREEICPVCGYEFAETPVNKVVYVIVAILLLALFLWFIF